MGINKKLLVVVTGLIICIAAVWICESIQGEETKYEVRPQIETIPEYKTDATRAIDAYERLMDRYMNIIETNLTRSNNDIKNISQNLNSITEKLASIDIKLTEISKRITNIEKKCGTEPPAETSAEKICPAAKQKKNEKVLSQQ
jgi:chromosome segregation ATPase